MQRLLEFGGVEKFSEYRQGWVSVYRCKFHDYLANDYFNRIVACHNGVFNLAAKSREIEANEIV